jgi:hypothetical protein
VKPQWVHYKLGKAIEQSYSDVLAHTLEVCKGAHLYNGYLASKDDHDSWETCTASAECKTVIIAMLTVMSGMDPHMISGNLGWDFGQVLSWVVLKWGFIGCGSVTVILSGTIGIISFEEMSLLPIY